MNNIILPELSSNILKCKSLPRSTVWSQYLINLIILITEPGSYFQCTYIVLHRKFSNWGHLLFHTPATLPASPWKTCFLVLSFKAFSEFLLSYWSAPTSLFITRPVFSAFSLPTKPSFFHLVLYAENTLLHQIKLSILLSVLQSTCQKI